MDIVASFSKAHECLYYRLDTAFSNLPLAHHPASLTAHEQLPKFSFALNQSYAQATFELRIGRVGVKSIKPLLGTIEHIRRELSWGISYPRPTHLSSPEEADIIQAFRGPASELGDAILVLGSTGNSPGHRNDVDLPVYRCLNSLGCTIGGDLFRDWRLFDFDHEQLHFGTDPADETCHVSAMTHAGNVVWDRQAIGLNATRAEAPAADDFGVQKWIVRMIDAVVDQCNSDGLTKLECQFLDS